MISSPIVQHEAGSPSLRQPAASRRRTPQARLKELRLGLPPRRINPAGECAIEGVKLIEEALRPAPQSRRFSSANPRARWPKSFCRKSPSAPRRSSCRTPCSNPIVPSEAPQGVAALVKLPSFSSAADARTRAADGPLVVAAGLQDPGNLGTIMRSAEAFAAAGIFLTEGTVSPYNSKVLRGSAGSIFRLPFLQISSAELLPLLRAQGIRLLATSSHKGTPLPEAIWTLPLAIFIGNEGAGLPREIMHQMDETLVIPQSAPVESLNAGVAASIVLYEAARAGQGERSNCVIGSIR